jgi:hypothetical protein
MSGASIAGLRLSSFGITGVETAASGALMVTAEVYCRRGRFLKIKALVAAPSPAWLSPSSAGTTRAGWPRKSNATARPLAPDRPTYR